MQVKLPATACRERVTRVAHRVTCGRLARSFPRPRNFVKFETESCLVIPDVHQDIAWVDRVLARESNFDRVVFLGDYFDTRSPLTFGPNVKATCAYLEKLRAELGDRATFLLGNHDIQYLEAKPWCDQRRTPRHLFYKCGPSYSQSTAKRVASDLPAEFWRSTRLFVVVNGWLLSHAGLAPSFWPEAPSLDASLAKLDAECATALTTMKAGPHPLLEAGEVRGGDAPVGGITWQDWNDEFVDELPLPQLVGHTSSSSGARQRGRSWCLDGRQTSYGVLTGSGLKVRAA